MHLDLFVEQLKLGCESEKWRRSYVNNSHAAATTCGEMDELQAAEQLVESRLCSTLFEDLNVDYAGTYGQ